MVQPASSPTNTIDDLTPIDNVDYPSSDGLPMAESVFQRKYILYAVDVLGEHFRDRKDIYVSGNLFIYYEERNPKAVVAPDVFVVMGAGNHDRPSYRLWQEPKVPDFVMEITSRRTRGEDQGPKRGTYAFLGVQEYWQYDPTGDYLTPQLQGFRLVGRNYEPIPEPPWTSGGLTFHSSVLNLELRLEPSGEFRFYNPTLDQPLLGLEGANRAREQAEQAREQAEQAREQAEVRAQREAIARQAAEERIAELEARLRDASRGP